MTFDEWLDEIEGSLTRREYINRHVDFAAVMTGNMSHNLARTRMYEFLEDAYLAGHKNGYKDGIRRGWEDGGLL